MFRDILNTTKLDDRSKSGTTISSQKPEVKSTLNLR